MLPDELKIAVFASGRGSNFEAILNAIQTGKIRNARIVLVISNNAEAGALTVARSNGIPALLKQRNDFSSEKAFAEALLRVLESYSVNFIVLAGYLKKIAPEIISRFRDHIINIHPALLPAFGGKGMYGHLVHQAVIAARSPISGATIHLVDEEYDKGPIVLQKSVKVSPDDTEEGLAEKILSIEHELYPEAIRLFAEGRIHLDGRHVTIMK